MSAATVTVEPREATAPATPRPTVPKIDAHLHVWSNGVAPFEWVVEPPEALHRLATAEKMRDVGEKAGVGGALIVQPANHKFDHSYVASALQKHPDYFRGMMLVDGSLPPLEAVASVEYAPASYAPGSPWPCCALVKSDRFDFDENDAVEPAPPPFLLLLPVEAGAGE